MTTTTRKFKITPFVAQEAEGSDISNPRNAGYTQRLADELYRVGNRGGIVYLGAADLRDLAEWLDAMYFANAQGGNPAGANSCVRTAERARDLAAEMEAA